VGDPVVQWQMVVKDPEATSRFYSSVFGWKIRTDNALGYRVVSTGSDRGIDGGIWPSPPEGHNLMQLFIEVADVDASLAKAIAHGATVIVPKSVLPDGDVLAIVLDPAGTPFGVYAPAPR